MTPRLARASARAAMLTLCLLLTACGRDPLTTALPLDPAGLGALQAQLDKLPAEERQLVRDYMARSRGDVLPAHLADPDEPFTARTFREAIVLQRDFVKKQAEQDAHRDALRADRDAVWAPLREALTIEVLQRDILPSDQAHNRPPTPGRALNNTPVLVSTYRLHNRSTVSIVSASGSVTVRSKDDPNSLMGLASCYFADTGPIAAADSKDLSCIQKGHAAGPAEEAYAALPRRDLLVSWEPREIRFSNGRELHGPR